MVQRPYRGSGVPTGDSRWVSVKIALLRSQPRHGGLSVTICPNCSTENRAEARYCMACGAMLASEAPAEVADAFAISIPADLQPPGESPPAD
ncbi:MAG: zinc ribbon domain-containing protein, partial [Anaerolineae bacterium]|nr:zinc ribbon domain-containing protein [Anaerolineae bacterium]